MYEECSGKLAWGCMIKLLLSIAFCLLNFGLYFTYLTINRKKLRVVHIIFLAVFWCLIMFIRAFSNTPYSVSNISISLFLIYLIGYLSYRFFFMNFFDARGITIPIAFIRVLKYVVVPFYTLWVSIMQIIQISR